MTDNTALARTRDEDIAWLKISRYYYAEIEDATRLAIVNRILARLEAAVSTPEGEQICEHGRPLARILDGTVCPAHGERELARGTEAGTAPKMGSTRTGE